MNRSAQVMGQAVKAMPDREGKYLTFTLADEEYGIGIRKIKEIIGMMHVRSVPKTPPFVKGVINLRGKVIPVIDLRVRFGMPVSSHTDRTCIVVVEIEGSEGNVVTTGIIVDSVSEVLNIKADAIEDTPAFGAAVDTRYILGMAKVGESVKLLLDIDRVLNSQEVTILEAAA
jgi:purine-binding chemotaxis protein CheW